MNGETIKKRGVAVEVHAATGAVGVSKAGHAPSYRPRRKAIDGFRKYWGRMRSGTATTYTAEDDSSRLDQSRTALGRQFGELEANGPLMRTSSRLAASTARCSPLTSTHDCDQETGCEAWPLSGHRLHGRADRSAP